MTSICQRFAAAAATAALTLALGGAFAVPAYASNFVDVPADHWAETSGIIDKAVAQGIIKGDSGYFRPEDKVTRAEVAAMLMRIAGVADGTYPNVNETPFVDVADNQWYTACINWAQDMGIMNGTQGYARPEAAVSREELACMLGNFQVRCAGETLSGSISLLSKYPDSSAINDWALQSMAWAVDMDILGGSANLQPGASATRAEATKMVVVLNESLNGTVDDPVNPPVDEPADDEIDGSTDNGGSDSIVGTAAVELALQFEGADYAYGGDSPDEGFDCSGLVYYVYSQLGYSLPHGSNSQLAYFQEHASRFVTDEADLQYGDVVFFPGHVAFYVGDGICFGARRPGVPASDCPMYAFGEFLGGGQL